MEVETRMQKKKINKYKSVDGNELKPLKSLAEINSRVCMSVCVTLCVCVRVRGACVCVSGVGNSIGWC
jgi:hypothetical protein